jgi:hypothetical protein
LWIAITSIVGCLTDAGGNDAACSRSMHS